MNKRILIGIAPKTHVLLAQDEMQGLMNIGYTCRSVRYGRNDQSVSKLNKLFGVIRNAFGVVSALYDFKPGLLYLNSRFEPVASTRDFLSLLIIRMFYFRKLHVVIKTHGSVPEFVNITSFFYKRIMLPSLFRRVDAWFFLSKEEREIIKDARPKDADKVFVTANIIDPSRSVASAEFRRQYDLEANNFNVLFVGRMILEKGIFSILESIPYIPEKDNCVFLFVGDGVDEEKAKQRAKELNIERNVRFLGFIEDQECDHFYANADILLFPTFYAEGFPMALFKSVAAGMPVITTHFRAAKDHLVSPENVLWVDAQSPEGIARAVSTLYQNETLRKSMSQNNRFLGKKFSRSRVCEEMNEVITAI